MKGILQIGLFLAIALISGGCNTIDDDRIPLMPVNINLMSDALWTTYGVSGYGDYRIFNRETREPRNFAWSEKTATGYGGVLLISGVNPYTLEAGVPLAYDLSCPVERKPDIRISIQSDGQIPVGVCPKCGSTYDLTERGGSPVSGIAKSENVGLSRYECRPGSYGGYLITN